MVRIYRWNIDKNICDEKIKELIINAVKKDNNKIILNKLVDIVNNNKTLDLKNDNKKRTVTNYLKSNHKGILNFLKSMNEIVVYEKDRYIYNALSKRHYRQRRCWRHIKFYVSNEII